MLAKIKRKRIIATQMSYKVYIDGKEYSIQTYKEPARAERNARIVDAFKRARKDNPKVGVTVLCQLLAPKFDLSDQYFYRLIKKHGLR